MNLRPQGRTSVTHPEALVPGLLVCLTGVYWILKEKRDGRWFGIRLGEHKEKNPQDVDWNLRNIRLPAYFMICDPIPEDPFIQEKYRSGF